FTITGSAGTVCAPTGVTNSSYIEASTVCSATQSVQTGGNFVISAPVANLSVVKRQTTPASLPGDPVTYSVIVTNVGTATLTSLTVFDTISPVVTGATGYATGFPTPVISQVAGGGTLFAWTGVPVTMAPGVTYTFTISGLAGVVCASTTVGNTAFVAASSACSATFMSASSPTFTLPAPTLTYTVQKLAVVPSPLTGQPVKYLIVVTNTGGTTLTNLTLWDTLSPVVQGATALEPSGFPTPAVTQVAGGGTLFVWTSDPTFTLPIAGAASTFTITVSGTVGTVCVNTTVGNTVYTAGGSACAQTAVQTAAATFTVAAQTLVLTHTKTLVLPASSPVAPGTAVQYRIVVANTGTGPIGNLM